MPSWTLAELAGLVGGQVEGDPGVSVGGLASLEDARESELSFVTGPRYAAAAVRSRAAAFLAPPGIELPGRPVVRVAQPYLAVATLLGALYPPAAASPGVHPTACLDEGATVAPDAAVSAFVVVGRDSVIEAGAVLHPHVVVGSRCRVGAGSVLHAHVVLREDVTLGRRVVVHAGSVLGADGFGYVFDGTRHRKIPQVGRVVVEDDVEIGANVTVDRATLGATVVGRGTKIDNLVQVAHNVVIGSDTIVLAQTGIAGSCRIGNRVVLGGQVGLADHVTIGDGAQVGSQAGVHGEVAPGQAMWGSPAIEAGVARRVAAALPRVPGLLHTVRRLEKRVAELERRLGGAESDG